MSQRLQRFFFWLQIAKEFSGKLIQLGPRSKQKVVVVKSDQKQRSVFYLVWDYLQAQVASMPLCWAETLGGSDQTLSGNSVPRLQPFYLDCIVVVLSWI